MMNKLKDRNVDLLFEAILTIRNIEECYNVFEDLCTVPEIKAIAQRLYVAKMLSEGHVYSDIVKETKASTATISRVKRCLEYGKDGYRLVLDRVKENREKLKKSTEENTAEDKAEE